MGACTSKNEKPVKQPKENNEGETKVLEEKVYKGMRMTSKDCRGVIYSYLSVQELAGTISRLSKYERKLLQELKEPGS